MDDSQNQPVNNAENQDAVFVATNTPPTKPPPALETGLIAWMRDNLFSSTLNTILTVIGSVIVVATIVSFVTWTVQDANWFAITFNFRGFMIGRYSAEYEWRTTLTALIAIFVCGAAVAIWIRRAARALLLTILAILVVILGLPPLVNSIYDLPPLYVGAGDIEIVEGSVTEEPLSQVAFLGREGEVVTIRFADEIVADEASLANLAGFSDVITNTVRNAANDRLLTIAERDELQAILIENATAPIPLLTLNQQEAYESFVDEVEIPAPIIEQYAINQITVEVDIIDNQTGESIATVQTLESSTDSVQFVLPHDGWFILQKVDANASASTEGAEEAAAETNPLDVRGVSVIRPPETTETAVAETAEAGSGLALLEVAGVYPILQSTSYQPESRAFVDTYIRVTDRFTTLEEVPEANDEALPFVNIIRNQYRGERTFADYLRVYVSPFLERIAFHTTILLTVGVAGYVTAILLERFVSRNRASQLTTYALVLLPLIIWVLVNGLYPVTTLFWLLLVGVGLLAIVLDRIGRVRGLEEWRLQSPPIVPLMVLAATIFVYWILLTTPGGGLPALILWLTPVLLSVAALSGASLQTGEDDLRGVTFSLSVLGFVVIALLVLIITQTSLVDLPAEWFLQPSDPRNWGGLLLTMMLTIYGIIIAFPIGVGLALGRRSDLPGIKYVCTAYIELVRGSPFITVLFFMQLLIPLISSELAEVPNSYRALIATVAFSAAYLAENVRGGLQSLPPGQLEAGRALGLSPWQTTRLITLPQALRAVIPALVGQFISLFKDTSLVAIVGLIDLTGFVNTMVVQAEFIGTRSEGLLFISVIYFVFSYIMSYVSRLLEASGSGSTRRNTL